MAKEPSKTSNGKLSEPDRLDAYIRVATPGAWLALGAVALVILALVVWFLLGEVEGVSILEALFG